MARKAPDENGAAAPEPAAPSIIDEVRQLVQLMIESDLGEVDVRDGERKIRLRRASVCFPPATAAPGQVLAAPPVAAPPPPAEEPAEELLEIKSPMVGTFYAAASPDSDPYVTVGAAVDEDTVVCIVEAMKVMNEVKAECAGLVAEVCVRNAQPVEYGQVLFRVRPA
jgi:acetyl-CoA carboxylase biotin carboxyl carrier protein